MPEKFCRFQRGYDPNSGRFYCAIGDWQNESPLCSYKSRLPRKGCDIANCEGVRVEELLGGELFPSNPFSEMFAISFDVGNGFRVILAPMSSLGTRGPARDLRVDATLLNLYLDAINDAARARLNKGLARPQLLC